MAVFRSARRSEESVNSGHLADREELRQGIIMRMGAEIACASSASQRARSTSMRRSASVGSARASPRSTDRSRAADDALSACRRQCSARGGVAAFIDAEHALDIDYAKKLGVDVENLLVSQPDTGEQALEICEILVRSGAIDVVVIDSVAALVPKAEIEGTWANRTWDCRRVS